MVETVSVIQPHLTWIVMESEPTKEIKADSVMAQRKTAPKKAEGEQIHHLASPYALVGAACEPRHQVTQVCLGAVHGLLLTDAGVVYTWGDNKYGQRGRPSVLREENNRPFEVPDLLEHEIVAIASGKNHCLALTGAGFVLGWGRNKAGQIGVGDYRDKTLPEFVRVAPVIQQDDDDEAIVVRLGEGERDPATGKKPKIVTISAGGNSSVASAENSDVWQWGEISEDFVERVDNAKKGSSKMLEAGAVGTKYPFLVACRGYQSFRSHMRKEKDKISISETGFNVFPKGDDPAGKEEKQTIKEYSYELGKEVEKIIEARKNLQKDLARNSSAGVQDSGPSQDDEGDEMDLEDNIIQLQNDIYQLEKEVDLYEGSFKSCEQQQAQNQEQIKNLMHQGSQLTEAQGKYQNLLLEDTTKSAEKKRFQEKLKEIEEFIHASQNTRATLLDQRAEIEKEKQTIQQKLTSRREERSALIARLKTVESLASSAKRATGGSDALIAATGELNQQMIKHMDEHKQLPKEFISAKLRVEKDRNFMKDIDDNVDAMTTDKFQGKDRIAAIKAMMKDNTSLRIKLNELMMDKMLKEELALDVFFKDNRDKEDAGPGALKNTTI